MSVAEGATSATAPRAQRSGVGVELLAAAATAIGPMSLAWSQRQGAWSTLVLCVSVSVVGGRTGSTIRAAVVLAGAALVTLATGWLGGVWLIAGFFLADWSVRGRPLVPSGPTAPSQAIPPVCVLLGVAAWGSSERAVAYGPIVPALAAVLVVSAMLWCVTLAGAGRWPVWAAAAVMITTSWAFAPEATAVSTLPRVGLAWLAAAVMSLPLPWSGPDRPKPAVPPRPDDGTVAALLCLPGVLWWTSHVSVWAAAWIELGSPWYSSWKTLAERLPGVYYGGAALSAAVLWIWTALVVGTALTIRGRSALTSVVVLGGAATGLAIAATSIWSLGGGIGG